MKPSSSLRSFLLYGSALFTVSFAQATSLYWDIDGIILGAGGAAPAGTWASSGTNWSTDSTGSTATTAYSTGTADDLFFSAGTNAFGAYTISVNSAQSAKSLTIEEGVVTFSGTGSLTLGSGNFIGTTQTGINTTIGGSAITLAGTNGLNKTGAGTLIYSGTASSALSGGITLSGGTLSIERSGTPFSSTNDLTFLGGNLQLKTVNTGSTALDQTFGNVTIGAGGGTLFVNSNTLVRAQATLGTITATTAGSFLVGIPGGSGSGAKTVNTKSVIDSTGILNARTIYAGGTANTGYDFAAGGSSDGGTTAGAITAYSGYIAFAASGTSSSVNYSLTTSAITGVTTESVNTLKVVGVNLTQNAGTTLTIQSGGLLSASGTASIISGGNLTAGNGSGSYDLMVFQGGTGGGITTITSDIVNNSGNAVNFVKAGPGTTILNSAKSYTGNTYVNAGILDFATFTPAGSGRNIYVVPGALVKFTSPTTTLMNRIAQTNEEFGIVSGGSASGTMDFSSSGANLPNAFLAGGWSTNNGKTENVTISITPANNQYRLGYAGATGSFGYSGTLTGSSNGLLVGGNNVVLTSANTFGGQTDIRTGGFLLLANPLALQNSALNTGTAAGTGALDGKFGLSKKGSNLANDAIVSTATLGGLVGSRNLLSAYTFVGNASSFGNNASSMAPAAITAFTLNPASGASYSYTGAIANFARDLTITKTGQGTQLLGGANTYTGTTTISDGTLQLGSASALGKGGSAGASTGATTVNSGATLDLNGITGVMEPIVLNGTGFGSNGALVNNSATAASISGGLASLQITSGGTYSSAPTVSISGTGSGATATATLGLTNASITSLSGGAGWVVGDLFTTSGGTGSDAVFQVTSVSSGAITGFNIQQAGTGYTTVPTGITKLTNVGTTPGTITVSFNASNYTVSGITLTNAGSGYDNTTTASFSAGSATAGVQHSTVTLASDSSIGGSGDIAIGAVVSESGGARSLTKVGAGTLTLSAVNSYTGATNITTGTLQLDGSTHSSSTVAVGTAGTLTGSGTVNGNATLTGGGIINKSSGSIAGTLAVTGGYWNGAGSVGGVVSSTSGTFNITGGANLTATSGVTATGGAVVVNGTLTGTLNANSSTTVSGTGTITGNATIQGTHNPGNSPGIQTFGSNLSYSGGLSAVNWELNGNTSTNAANPNAIFDQVIVGGDLNFADATTINLSFIAAGSNVLWSDTFWDSPQSWTLFDVAGTTTNFGNLSLNTVNWLDSGSFDFNTARPGSSFTLTQVNNDVVLSYAAVPEPGAALLGGLGMLALLRRRRA